MKKLLYKSCDNDKIALSVNILNIRYSYLIPNKKFKAKKTNKKAADDRFFVVKYIKMECVKVLI